jgi:hypothetical protein
LILGDFYLKGTTWGVFENRGDLREGNLQGVEKLITGVP